MLRGEAIGSATSLTETKLAAKLIESFFLWGGGCQTYGILLQNVKSEKYIVEI